MKILVIGTVVFTKEMLKKLIVDQLNIVGVVTTRNNNINTDYADLEPICKKHNIPCFHTQNINAEHAVKWIRDSQPDVIFCLGWSQLIGTDILMIPPKGVIGFHPAALPKNRGRHPIIWALVLGLHETASTFFLLDKNADTGDIVSQVNIAIEEKDDAQTLYQKIIEAAGLQLLKVVKELKFGRLKKEPQNKEIGNNWRKRNYSDGIIDWRMSARSINNLVRGLTHPYVGAEFQFKKESFKLWKARVVEMDNIVNLEPGKVIAKGTLGYIVRCGEGCIELCDVHPPITLQKGDYL